MVGRRGGETLGGSEVDDVRITLAEHETRLADSLVRLAGLETKTDVVLSEIHKLNALVATQLAKPTFKLGDALQAITHIGLIAGLIVSGIVYVTNASYSAQVQRFIDVDSSTTEQLSDIKSRMSRLENVLLDSTKRAIAQ